MNKIIKPDLILGAASNLAIARKEKIFLVGGYIRDILLGRITYDIDFALDGNAEIFSKKLAQKLKGNFFVLDEETQTFRIVCKGYDDTYNKSSKLNHYSSSRPWYACQSSKLDHYSSSRVYSACWNIDISKMQGKDIMTDLKRRDFTIDAMALTPEVKFFQPRGLIGRLIDPFGGVKDLKKKIIRVTSPNVLNDDPLRLLRAFRLSATLGFKIESKTLKAISTRSSLIKKVSRERIRDEFFKILSVDNSYKYISQIDKIGLLEKIIPQIKQIKKEPGLWEHSLLTLKFLEEVVKKNNKAKKHLEKEISGHKRITLLKFASLFHDIGKPSTKKIKEGKVSFIGHDRIGTEIVRKISKELRLSNKEIKIISKISKYHMRVHYLINLNFITNRAIIRLIRDLDEETIELLLFTLADFLATPKELKKQTFKKNQKVTKKIIRQYFKFKESKKFVRLITGNDLINNFHMKEGPQIGKILEEIELAQRENKIKTRKEALHLVSILLKHQSF